MRRILRRFRAAVADPSPIVQTATNNGCSFESCPERWEGQRWGDWPLCRKHYAQCRGEARTPEWV